MDDELQVQAPLNTPPQPQAVPKSGKGKVVGVVLLCLLLVGGALYGLYYWQNKKVKDANAQVQQLTVQVSDLNKQLTDAKATEAKSTTSAYTNKTSTDDLVLAAAKAYCEAGVDPTTKKAMVFTAGTLEGKKVLYSSDKLFAQVGGTCNNGTRSASTVYVLKKANDVWVVVQTGEGPDPDATKLYNIPSTFN